MTSQEKIQNRTNLQKHICIGLDSDITKIPQHLRSYSDPVFEFNRIIIENTSQEAAAYKLNLAFYESEGQKGFETLYKTMEIMPKDILVIGDAKRGDIGNTSEMYAKSLFEHFGFDASTLNAYMGYDAIEPFARYKDKINYILVLTSNKGSADFQKMKLQNGKFLYEQMLETVKQWNTDNNLGIVFGATNSEQLLQTAEDFRGLQVLLPGIGAQGGSLEDVIKTFKGISSQDFTINVSRAVIYASDGKDFGDKAKKVLNDYNSQIKNIFE